MRRENVMHAVTVGAPPQTSVSILSYGTRMGVGGVVEGTGQDPVLSLWTDAHALGLPRRAGDRPMTRPSPHVQMSHRPSWAAVERVYSAALTLPSVQATAAGSGPIGTMALRVESHAAADDAHAFLFQREFIHFHPLPYGSLHLTLPDGVRNEAIATGWAEPHPLADRSSISPLAAMVYAPRDEAEADVILRIVHASWQFATSTRP